jgi:hypothetical protein
MNKLTVGGLNGLWSKHPYLPAGLSLPGYAPPARSLASVLVPFFGVAGAVTAAAWRWAGEGWSDEARAVGGGCVWPLCSACRTGRAEQGREGAAGGKKK